MSSKCAACTTIAAAVKDWSNPGGGHVNIADRKLGTWQAYLDRKDCKSCRAIVEYLSSTEDGSTVRSPECCMLFKLEEGRFRIGAPFFCSFISEDGPDHFCQDEHRFFELYPSPAHRFFGDGPYFFDLDPSWIDLDRVARWLQHCEGTHDCSGDIRPCATDATSRLARLIDVDDSCLVDVKENSSWPRYVSLSYVWGTSLPGLATFRSNVKELHEPGSIEAQAAPNFLAATVKDAMAVARSLGFRYLWADRLCIIQDDPDDKASQIKLMGSIYERAVMTIVAMDGDHADYGLRGIQGNSPPRTYKQRFLDVTTDVRLLCAPVRETATTIKTYHTRAWTFQERLLSARKLCFFTDTIFWECKEGLWREELACEADDASVEPYESLARFSHGTLWTDAFPDLRKYYTLVEEYCKRGIGYDADALNACSAILSRLQPFFPGGFHFGIPEFFFDVAILWAPTRLVVRRSKFPSWSWLGWKGGAISFAPYAKHFFTAADYDNRISLEDITMRPETEWFRIGKDGHSGCKINSQCFTWRAKAQEEHVEGWDRNGAFWNPRNMLDKAYVFRYPILVGDQGKAADHPICTQSCDTRLRFTAARVRGASHVGNVADKTSPSDETYFVHLIDSRGEWAGVLSSNVTKPEDHAPGGSCELVAVSSAAAQGPSLVQEYLEMRTVEALELVDVYEYYNVLEIEWLNDTAFRIGVGRVWKPAWESASIEMVDVLLG